MGCGNSKPTKDFQNCFNTPSRVLRSSATPFIYENLFIKSIIFTDYTFKSEDIFVFIKTGDYDKLDFIIKTQNIRSLIGLCGFKDTDKKRSPRIQKMTSQKLWNPLLLAINFKQTNMVQYLIQEQKFPLKLACKDPNNDYDEIFGLKITIINRDIATLSFLWNQYYAWDIQHLEALLNFIEEENYLDGLKIIKLSFTTDNILQYLSGETGNTLVRQWIAHYQKDINSISLQLLTNFQQLSLYILFESQNQLPSEKFKSLMNIHLRTLSTQHVSDYKHKNPQAYEQHMQRLEQIKHPLFKKVIELEAIVDRDQFRIERSSRSNFLSYFNKFQHSQFFSQIKSLSCFEYFDQQQISEVIKQIMPDEQNKTFHQITVFHDILLLNQNLTNLNTFFEECLKNGINFNQALRFNDDKKESSQLDLNLLIKLCIYFNRIDSISALLSLDHLWTSTLIESILNYMNSTNNSQNCKTSLVILKSNIFQKYLQTLQLEQRSQLLKIFFENLDLQNSLIEESAYSILYLSQILNKKTYIAFKDYQKLQRALTNVDYLELNDYLDQNLVQTKRLIKYIFMCDKLSNPYFYGQEILEVFKKLPVWNKFKGHQNDTVLFEDSEPEGILDEGFIQLKFKNIIKKNHQRNELSQLNDIIELQDEEQLLELFKLTKSIEALFVKIPTEQTVEIYTSIQEQSDNIRYDSLNIVQLLIALDMSDTALGYLLKEHQIRSHLNLNKNLPGSILILNNNDKFEEGTSLILRILISWGRISALISILESYPSIWTSYNLIIATQVLLAREEFDFLERILDMSLSIDILQNASKNMRKKFTYLMESLRDTTNDYIYKQYVQSGYLERFQFQVLLEKIYPAICEDDDTYLRTLLVDVKGIGDVNMNDLNDAEMQEFIINGQPLQLSQLNIFLLAIIHESYKCLVEIITKYPQCVREALKGSETSDQEIQVESYQFDTMGIAILSQSKNIRILRYLMKQEGFIPSHRDYLSLIEIYREKNHYQGLQEIFKSYHMQVVYASMDYKSKQKSFIREMLTSQVELLSMLIRPYLTTIFAVLLETKEEIQNSEQIAIYCLRGLVKDDFEVLIYREQDLLHNALEFYYHQNKNLESIMKNILFRIENELNN